MASYSEELLDRQNPDGGWGYSRVGSSWTEPTCYALLALASGEVSSAKAPGGAVAVRKGLQWLMAGQRSDGGWAPRPGVDESTWVTALALLLPPNLSLGDRRRAAKWLLGQSGRESGFTYRLRLRLLGVRVDPNQQYDGWPWYPGTAAWVAPTALTFLALQKLNSSTRDAQIEKRLAEGKAFLLARRCRDGGWNHGSTQALGYDSDSYPETTGLALLALHDSKASEIGNAVEVAERHLRDSHSLEATSWLTLGLLAHGRSPSEASVMPHQGTVAISLAAIAVAARQGRNLFVR